MLSEYEAAMLTRVRASGNGYRLSRISKRTNRIGAAFLVLSFMSAGGLLHWTVSGRAEYERANQAENTENSGKNLCAIRMRASVAARSTRGARELPGRKTLRRIPDNASGPHCRPPE